MITVITYGTFDLFHVGHLRLLARAKALGDRLIVGVSTDEFNISKGKKSVLPFCERIEIISALRCVDLAISEHNWEQKSQDILDHGVSTFVMGDDWRGRFDYLRNLCRVEYLNRTKGISTTELVQSIRFEPSKEWRAAVNG